MMKTPDPGPSLTCRAAPSDDSAEPDGTIRVVRGSEQVVQEIAVCRGVPFTVRCATEHVLSGWFARPTRWRRRPPQREPDLNAYWHADWPLRGRDEVGTAIALSGIYLPEPYQRQGLGRALVEGLAALWASQGVDEIHASPGTSAGAAALPSWGFVRSGEILGLDAWYLAL